MDNAMNTLISTLKILTGCAEWAYEDDKITNNKNNILLKAVGLTNNNKVLFNVKTQLSTNLFDQYTVDKKYFYISSYKDNFKIDKTGGVIHKYDLDTLELVETIQLRDYYNAELRDGQIFVYRGARYNINSKPYLDLEYNYVLPNIASDNMTIINLDKYSLVINDLKTFMSIIDSETHIVKRYIDCNRYNVIIDTKNPTKIKFVGKYLETDLLDLDELKAYKCKVPEKYKLGTARISEIATECFKKHCEKDRVYNKDLLELQRGQYDAILTYLMYMDSPYKHVGKSEGGFYIISNERRLNFFRFTDSYNNVMLTSLSDTHELNTKYNLSIGLDSLQDIIEKLMRRSSYVTPFLKSFIDKLAEIADDIKEVEVTTFESDSEFLNNIIECLRE